MCSLLLTPMSIIILKELIFDQLANPQLLSNLKVYHCVQKGPLSCLISIQPTPPHHSLNIHINTLNIHINTTSSSPPDLRPIIAIIFEKHQLLSR
jgi:hypothetical protein